jgi:hypothetical protein
MEKIKEKLPGSCVHTSLCIMYDICVYVPPVLGLAQSYVGLVTRVFCVCVVIDMLALATVN